MPEDHAYILAESIKAQAKEPTKFKRLSEDDEAIEKVLQKWAKGNWRRTAALRYSFIEVSQEVAHAAEDETLRWVRAELNIITCISDNGERDKALTNLIYTLQQKVEPPPDIEKLERVLCKCGHKLVEHRSSEGCCKMVICHCEEFQQVDEELIK